MFDASVRSKAVPVSILQHIPDLSPFAWLKVFDPQRVYTIPELQELTSRKEGLGFTQKVLRELFINEPGVMVISNPRRRTRVYRNLRVPGVIVIAVFYRLMNKEGRS